VPFRVTDRVRVLPHSVRGVLLGTAEATIRVAMKNRWGSVSALLSHEQLVVSALLSHERLTVNFDVRECEIEYLQAMGPVAMLCTSFKCGFGFVLKILQRLLKKPIAETYQRVNRPIQETYSRDLLQRPIKETC